MKRKTKQALLIIWLILLALLASACGVEESRIPKSEDITEKNIAEVSAILRESGLSNVDLFETWVKDYRDDTGSNLGASDFIDTNCRMTVMLLAKDALHCDHVRQGYFGTYLMFDVDAIQNIEAYRVLRGKMDLFTTIFGETAVEGEDFSSAYADLWKSCGITMENDRCSVISVIFLTYEGDAAFVGHTGLLIDRRADEKRDSDYLFVEKIAFAAPYQMTKLNHPEEIISLFSQRPDYSSEEGQPAPVVFQNDKFLGPLH